ncbi:MAG: hypothetical protein ACRCXD_18470 [Luteolibacter sp.]
MKFILRIPLIALAVITLHSCASPSNPSAMVPTHLSTGKKFNKSVAVAVTGGQATNPLWTSQVSNEDFAEALKQAIEKNGPFSQVIRSGSGTYQLDVRLIQLRQPMVGINMTVQAEIEWRLKQSSTGKVIWQRVTNKSHTATMGDSVAGVTRLKMANEGAIRENIKEGLEQIARHSL